MFFDFFNKSIELTAYTNQPAYSRNAAPTYKKYEAPSFLKKLVTVKRPVKDAGILVPSTDVRTCPGIKEFLTSGIQIKAWEDFIIKVWPNGTYTWYFAELSPSKSMGTHPREQWGDLYPQNRINVKLNSPWSFKSNKPAKFLMMESHYSTSKFRENNIWVPPGIIDFSKQRSTNIHMMFEIREEPYEVTFKMGEPLITIFPLTQSDINFSVKTVSTEELHMMNDLPFTFNSRYYKQIE